MQKQLTKVAMAMAAAGVLASGYAYGKGGLNCGGPFTGAIDSNVVVELGATCTLFNVSVAGNIQVRGGTLIFRGTNFVSGNVSVGNHEPDDTPGRLLLGAEGDHAPGPPASLTIGTSSKAANLSIHDSTVGTNWFSDKFLPNPPRDALTVFGNVSVNETSLVNHYINTLDVNGVLDKKLNLKKGNLTCNDDDALFASVTVDGNQSGDGSCIAP
jgi:hypothetical protein